MSDEERAEDVARRFAGEVLHLRQENARLDARLHEMRLMAIMLAFAFVLALTLWVFA